MQKFLFTLVALFGFSLASGAYADCRGTDILDQIIGDNQEEFQTRTDEFLYGDARHWEVTRDGMRSVLIGTYHLADPRTATLSEAMKREVEAASILLVEVTSAQEAALEKSLETDPSRILNLDPSAKRLKDQLTPQEWETLVTRARQIEIPEMALNIMQPWFAGLSLVVPPCELASQKSGKKGLDWMIEDVALAAGIPVIGLETFDEIFTIFSSDPVSEQIRYLKINLAMNASSHDEIETMTQLYLQDRIGEIWFMGELLLRKVLSPEQAKIEMDKMFELLLVQRNLNWMKTLLPALEQGNAVVAVGALHLGSEGGLLALLEREGYSIKRLSLTP